MTEELLYDVQDHIAVITLNRPEKLNAFSNEMLDAWQESITRASVDQNVRVIIVTGEGRGFCSGADVGRERAGADVLGGDPNAPAANRNSLRNSVQRVPRALFNCEKPYIAAVNGAAVGAGMDMASMADLRIASDRAKFGMAYVRMALIPGDGGCFYLPRIVGMSKALELMWTGKIFTAEEALEMGYVSQVVEHDDLMPTTLGLAEQIAKNAGGFGSNDQAAGVSVGGDGSARIAGDGRPRDGHCPLDRRRRRRPQGLRGEARAKLPRVLGVARYDQQTRRQDRTHHRCQRWHGACHRPTLRRARR